MNQFDKQGDVICEAIVRELGNCKRWSAVQEAHRALLNVRRMQKQLSDEQKYYDKTATGPECTKKHQERSLNGPNNGHVA